MNLNNNPTIAALAALLLVCNDNAGHHIVWVDTQGNVFITLHSPGQSLANLQFRLEALAQGQGFVGPDAAQDEIWVKKLFDALVDLWRNGAVGCQDIF